MSFNLAVILRESAAASPNKPVVVYDGGHLTYAQVDALSDQLAAGLKERGLRPGTLSACSCRTSPSSWSPTSGS
jgi:long-chain acyl-CoA synthetase